MCEVIKPKPVPKTPQLEWYKRESAEDQFVPLSDQSSSKATCQMRSWMRPQSRHQMPAQSGPPDRGGGNQIEHRNHQERRNKVTLLRLVQVQGVATGGYELICLMCDTYNRYKKLVGNYYCLDLQLVHIPACDSQASELFISPSLLLTGKQSWTFLPRFTPHVLLPDLARFWHPQTPEMT
ncbi:hypothetical protein H920_15185 [Fukomys damarensis]|uniref:Uncharacterized protein n=1 Tax=Fukomys damarensis TaxID=885580 RepID=A0A091CZR2_FUKDA|nr:hypothetical protein H920_15185 [Fukomys damarensis]